LTGNKPPLQRTDCLRKILDDFVGTPSTEPTSFDIQQMVHYHP